MPTMKPIPAARRVAALFAGLLILTTPPAALSQIRAKEARVQFARGKTGTVLRGSTPKVAEGDFDQYLLGARENQSLRLRLRSADAKAYVIIYSLSMNPPDDCISCRRGDRLREWSGRLPVTGDYSIQVYTESQGGVPYTIAVSAR
jgi:hypothetical protein